MIEEGVISKIAAGKTKIHIEGNIDDATYRNLSVIFKGQNQLQSIFIFGETLMDE